VAQEAEGLCYRNVYKLLTDDARRIAANRRQGLDLFAKGVRRNAEADPTQEELEKQHRANG